MSWLHLVLTHDRHIMLELILVSEFTASLFKDQLDKRFLPIILCHIDALEFSLDLLELFLFGVVLLLQQNTYGVLDDLVFDYPE